MPNRSNSHRMPTFILFLWSIAAISANAAELSLSGVDATGTKSSGTGCAHASDDVTFIGASSLTLSGCSFKSLKFAESVGAATTITLDTSTTVTEFITFLGLSSTDFVFNMNGGTLGGLHFDKTSISGLSVSLANVALTAPSGAGHQVFFQNCEMSGSLNLVMDSVTQTHLGDIVSDFAFIKLSNITNSNTDSALRHAFTVQGSSSFTHHHAIHHNSNVALFQVDGIAMNNHHLRHFDVSFTGATVSYQVSNASRLAAIDIADDFHVTDSTFKFSDGSWDFVGAHNTNLMRVGGSMRDTTISLDGVKLTMVSGLAYVFHFTVPVSAVSNVVVGISGAEFTLTGMESACVLYTYNVPQLSFTNFHMSSSGSRYTLQSHAQMLATSPNTNWPIAAVTMMHNTHFNTSTFVFVGDVCSFNGAATNNARYNLHSHIRDSTFANSSFTFSKGTITSDEFGGIFYLYNVNLHKSHVAVESTAFSFIGLVETTVSTVYRPVLITRGDFHDSQFIYGNNHVARIEQTTKTDAVIRWVQIQYTSIRSSYIAVTNSSSVLDPLDSSNGAQCLLYLYYPRELLDSQVLMQDVEYYAVRSGSGMWNGMFQIISTDSVSASAASVLNNKIALKNLYLHGSGGTAVSGFHVAYFNTATLDLDKLEVEMHDIRVDVAAPTAGNNRLIRLKANTLSNSNFDIRRLHYNTRGVAYNRFLYLTWAQSTDTTFYAEDIVFDAESSSGLVKFFSIYGSSVSMTRTNFIVRNVNATTLSGITSAKLMTFWDTESGVTMTESSLQVGTDSGPTSHVALVAPDANVDTVFIGSTKGLVATDTHFVIKNTIITATGDKFVDLERASLVRSSVVFSGVHFTQIDGTRISDKVMFALGSAHIEESTLYYSGRGPASSSTLGNSIYLADAVGTIWLNSNFEVHNTDTNVATMVNSNGDPFKFRVKSGSFTNSRIGLTNCNLQEVAFSSMTKISGILHFTNVHIASSFSMHNISHIDVSGDWHGGSLNGNIPVSDSNVHKLKLNTSSLSLSSDSAVANMIAFSQSSIGAVELRFRGTDYANPGPSSDFAFLNVDDTNSYMENDGTGNGHHKRLVEVSGGSSITVSATSAQAKFAVFGAAIGLKDFDFHLTDSSVTLQSNVYTRLIHVLGKTTNCTISMANMNFPFNADGTVGVDNLIYFESRVVNLDLDLQSVLAQLETDSGRSVLIDFLDAVVDSRVALHGGSYSVVGGPGGHFIKTNLDNINTHFSMKNLDVVLHASGNSGYAQFIRHEVSTQQTGSTIVENCDIAISSTKAAWFFYAYGPSVGPTYTNYQFLSSNNRVSIHTLAQYATDENLYLFFHYSQLIQSTFVVEKGTVKMTGVTDARVNRFFLIMHSGLTNSTISMDDINLEMDYTWTVNHAFTTTFASNSYLLFRNWTIAMKSHPEMQEHGVVHLEQTTHTDSYIAYENIVHHATAANADVDHFLLSFYWGTMERCIVSMQGVSVGNDTMSGTNLYAMRVTQNHIVNTHFIMKNILWHGSRNQGSTYLFGLAQGNAGSVDYQDNTIDIHDIEMKQVSQTAGGSHLVSLQGLGTLTRTNITVYNVHFESTTYDSTHLLHSTLESWTDVHMSFSRVVYQTTVTVATSGPYMAQMTTPSYQRSSLRMHDVYYNAVGVGSIYGLHFDAATNPLPMLHSHFTFSKIKASMITSGSSENVFLYTPCGFEMEDSSVVIGSSNTDEDRNTFDIRSLVSGSDLSMFEKSNNWRLVRSTKAFRNADIEINGRQVFSHELVSPYSLTTNFSDHSVLEYSNINLKMFGDHTGSRRFLYLHQTHFHKSKFILSDVEVTQTFVGRSYFLEMFSCEFRNSLWYVNNFKADLKNNLGGSFFFKTYKTTVDTSQYSWNNIDWALTDQSHGDYSDGIPIIDSVYSNTYISISNIRFKCLHDAGGGCTFMFLGVSFLNSQLSLDGVQIETKTSLNTFGFLQGYDARCIGSSIHLNNWNASAMSAGRFSMYEIRDPLHGYQQDDIKLSNFNVKAQVGSGAVQFVNAQAGPFVVEESKWTFENIRCNFVGHLGSDLKIDSVAASHTFFQFGDDRSKKNKLINSAIELTNVDYTFTRSAAGHRFIDFEFGAIFEKASIKLNGVRVTSTQIMNGNNDGLYFARIDNFTDGFDLSIANSYFFLESEATDGGIAVAHFLQSPIDNLHLTVTDTTVAATSNTPSTATFPTTVLWFEAAAQPLISTSKPKSIIFRNNNLHVRGPVSQVMRFVGGWRLSYLQFEVIDTTSLCEGNHDTSLVRLEAQEFHYSVFNVKGSRSTAKSASGTGSALFLGTWGRVEHSHWNVENSSLVSSSPSRAGTIDSNGFGWIKNSVSFKRVFLLSNQTSAAETSATAAALYFGDVEVTEPVVHFDDESVIELYAPGGDASIVHAQHSNARSITNLTFAFVGKSAATFTGNGILAAVLAHDLSASSIRLGATIRMHYSSDSSAAVREPAKNVLHIVNTMAHVSVMCIEGTDVSDSLVHVGDETNGCHHCTFQFDAARFTGPSILPRRLRLSTIHLGLGTELQSFRDAPITLIESTITATNIVVVAHSAGAGSMTLRSSTISFLNSKMIWKPQDVPTIAGNASAVDAASPALLSITTQSNIDGTWTQSSSVALSATDIIVDNLFTTKHHSSSDPGHDALRINVESPHTNVTIDGGSHTMTKRVHGSANLIHLTAPSGSALNFIRVSVVGATIRLLTSTDQHTVTSRNVLYVSPNVASITNGWLKVSSNDVTFEHTYSNSTIFSGGISSLIHLPSQTSSSIIAGDHNKVSVNRGSEGDSELVRLFVGSKSGSLNNALLSVAHNCIVWENDVANHNKSLHAYPTVIAMQDTFDVTNSKLDASDNHVVSKSIGRADAVILDLDGLTSSLTGSGTVMDIQCSTFGRDYRLYRGSAVAQSGSISWVESSASRFDVAGCTKPDAAWCPVVTATASLSKTFRTPTASAATPSESASMTHSASDATQSKSMNTPTASWATPSSSASINTPSASGATVSASINTPTASRATRSTSASKNTLSVSGATRSESKSVDTPTVSGATMSESVSPNSHSQTLGTMSESDSRRTPTVSVSLSSSESANSPSKSASVNTPSASGETPSVSRSFNTRSTSMATSSLSKTFRTPTASAATPSESASMTRSASDATQSKSMNTPTASWATPSSSASINTPSASGATVSASINTPTAAATHSSSVSEATPSASVSVQTHSLSGPTPSKSLSPAPSVTLSQSDEASHSVEGTPTSSLTRPSTQSEAATTTITSMMDGTPAPTADPCHLVEEGSAGPSQTALDGYSTTMQATLPNPTSQEYAVYGEWQITKGTASIANKSSPTTQVNGSSLVQLDWVVSFVNQPSCTNAFFTTTVTFPEVTSCDPIVDCNGNGACDAKTNACVCFDSDSLGHFDGLKCEKCTAAYTGDECTTAVSCQNGTATCANGLCNDAGTFCHCNQTTSGGRWSGKLCDACVRDASLGYWSGANCNTCVSGYFPSPSTTDSSFAACTIFCDAATQCNNHGSCSATTGDCQCFDDDTNGHWTGTFCSECIVSYFGASCTKSCIAETSCSAHGFCITGTSSCSCYSSASRGFFASSHTYDLTSGRPQCDVCADGFEGPGCNISTTACTSTNCVHGTCVDGLCVCSTSFDNASTTGVWDGPQCDVCAASPALGYWANPTIGSVQCSVCAAGYWGANCSLLCPNNCTQHGTCSSESSGTCVCDDNFEDGFWGGDDVCSTCTDGYEGSECLQPACSSDNCVFGTCSTDDGCVCFFNATFGFFTGSDCSNCYSTSTRGYSGTDCKECATGFYGDLCDTYCDAFETCNGNGVCGATTGQCRCNNDTSTGFWTGASCDQCVDGFTFASGCTKEVVVKDFTSCPATFTTEFATVTFDESFSLIVATLSTASDQGAALFKSQQLTSVDDQTDCSNFLTPQTMSLITTATATKPASCYFTSSTRFVIELGNENTIAFNDTMTFLPDVVFAVDPATVGVSGFTPDATCGSGNPYANIRVQLPASVGSPSATLSAPSSVGNCEGATLDASASQTTSPRTAFTFTVVNTSAPAALRNFLIAATDVVVTIPAGFITVGVWEFNVKVSDSFTGLSSTAAVYVDKKATAPPTIAYSGSDEIRFVGAEGTSIEVLGGFTPCDFVSDEKSLSYKWSFSPALPASNEALFESFDEAALDIPENVLVVGVSYTLTVNVTELENGTETSSSQWSTRSFTAIAEPSTLELSLSGGSGTASNLNALVVDLTCTDPDNEASSEAPEVEWSCSGLGCDSTITVLLAAQSTPNLNLAAGWSQQTGTLQLKFVCHLHGKTQNSTSSMLVTSVSMPSVRLRAPADIVSRGDKLQISSETGALRPSFKWYCIEGCTQLINLADTSISPLGDTSESLVLQADTLSAGTQYTFQLNVTDAALSGDPNSNPGSAIVTVSTLRGPSGGSFGTDTSNVYSWQTVTVYIANWVTDKGAYPLSFAVFQTDEAGTKTEIAEYGAHSSVEVIAPYTSSATIMTLELAVIDKNGNEASAQLHIPVKYDPQTDEDDETSTTTTTASANRRRQEKSDSSDPDHETGKTTTSRRSRHTSGAGPWRNGNDFGPASGFGNSRRRLQQDSDAEETEGRTSRATRRDTARSQYRKLRRGRRGRGRGNELSEGPGGEKESDVTTPDVSSAPQSTISRGGRTRQTSGGQDTTVTRTPIDGNNPAPVTTSAPTEEDLCTRLVTADDINMLNRGRKKKSNNRHRRSVNARMFGRKARMTRNVMSSYVADQQECATARRQFGSAPATTTAAPRRQTDEAEELIDTVEQGLVEMLGDLGNTIKRGKRNAKKMKQHGKGASKSVLRGVGKMAKAKKLKRQDAPARQLDLQQGGSQRSRRAETETNPEVIQFLEEQRQATELVQILSNMTRSLTEGNLDGENMTMSSDDIQLSCSRSASNGVGSAGHGVGDTTITMEGTPEGATTTSSVDLCTMQWNSNPYAGADSEDSEIGAKLVSFELNTAEGENVAVNNTPLIFTIPRVATDPDNTTQEVLACVYYDIKNMSYSSEGCETVEVSNTSITCRCTHLTDFTAKVNRVEFGNFADAKTAGIALVSSVASIMVILVVFGFVEDQRRQRRYIREKHILAHNCKVETIAHFNADTITTRPKFYVGEKQKTSLRLFWGNLTQMHPWLSPFFGHPASNMTVSQRVFVLFVTIIVSLFANGLTFQGGDDESMSANEIAVQLITAMFISIGMSITAATIVKFPFENAPRTPCDQSNTYTPTEEELMEEKSKLGVTDPHQDILSVSGSMNGNWGTSVNATGKDKRCSSGERPYAGVDPLVALNMCVTDVMRSAAVLAHSTADEASHSAAQTAAAQLASSISVRQDLPSSAENGHCSRSPKVVSELSTVVKQLNDVLAARSKPAADPIVLTLSQVQQIALSFGLRRRHIAAISIHATILGHSIANHPEGDAVLERSSEVFRALAMELGLPLTATANSNEDRTTTNTMDFLENNGNLILGGSTAAAKGSEPKTSSACNLAAILVSTAMQNHMGCTSIAQTVGWPSASSCDGEGLAIHDELFGSEVHNVVWRMAVECVRMKEVVLAEVLFTMHLLIENPDLLFVFFCTTPPKSIEALVAAVLASTINTPITAGTSNPNSLNSSQFQSCFSSPSQVFSPTGTNPAEIKPEGHHRSGIPIGRMWTNFYCSVLHHTNSPDAYTALHSTSNIPSIETITSLLDLTPHTSVTEYGSVWYSLDVERQIQLPDLDSAIGALGGSTQSSFVTSLVLSAHTFRLAQKPNCDQRWSLSQEERIRLGKASLLATEDSTRSIEQANFRIAPKLASGFTEQIASLKGSNAKHDAADRLDSIFGSAVGLGLIPTLKDIVTPALKRQSIAKYRGGAKPIELATRYHAGEVEAMLQVPSLIMALLNTKLRSVLVSVNSAHINFYGTIECGRLLAMFTAMDKGLHTMASFGRAYDKEIKQLELRRVDKYLAPSSKVFNDSQYSARESKIANNVWMNATAASYRVAGEEVPGNNVCSTVYAGASDPLLTAAVSAAQTGRLELVRYVIPHADATQYPMTVLAKYHPRTFGGTGSLICPHIGIVSAANLAQYGDRVELFEGDYTAVNFANVKGTLENELMIGPAGYFTLATSKGTTPSSTDESDLITGEWKPATTSVAVVGKHHKHGSAPPPDVLLTAEQRDELAKVRILPTAVMKSNASHVGDIPPLITFSESMHVKVCGVRIPRCDVAISSANSPECALLHSQIQRCEAPYRSDSGRAATTESNEIKATGTTLRKVWLSRTLPWWAIVPGYFIAICFFALFCFLCIFLTANFSDAKATEWAIRSAVTISVIGLIVNPLIIGLMSQFALYTNIALSLEAASF